MKSLKSCSRALRHRILAHRYFVFEQVDAALVEFVQRQPKLRETVDNRRLALGIRVAFHAVQIDVRRVVRSVRQHDVHQHPIVRAVNFVRV